MPGLNFQKQFVQAVENGLDQMYGRPLRHPGVRPKLQTIRANRRDGEVVHRVGVTEYLYTGMRTKACRKLGVATCVSATRIIITWSSFRIGTEKTVWARPNAGSLWDQAYGHDLARDDGFIDWDDMARWFEKNHGLRFEGQLIKLGALS